MGELEYIYEWDTRVKQRVYLSVFVLGVIIMFSVIQKLSQENKKPF